MKNLRDPNPSDSISSHPEAAQFVTTCMASTLHSGRDKRKALAIDHNIKSSGKRRRRAGPDSVLRLDNKFV